MIARTITFIAKLLTLFIIFIPTGCLDNIHEIPEIPASLKFHLQLNYETDMPVWEHLYEEESGHAMDSIPYDSKSVRPYGEMRYIVRAYPFLDNDRVSQTHSHEYIFTRDIVNGYDCEVTLDIAPGKYNIMVWSDMVQNRSFEPFYNVSDFGEITLQGNHQGNNDYRDAFRGRDSLNIIADIIERAPDTLNITMQRPLAKYEFVTTDIADFLRKEQTRVETKVELEDYQVIFYYVGFMPSAYGLFTDRPVDSSTGVMFKSKISHLSDTEASIGFDYAFIGESESAVTVQIGIYDKTGLQLSLSEPIAVPLKRSYHTIMRGMFLMSDASGGVSINPDFDGDYNIVFP